jgi:predicted DNA-binding transcriptional regulator YafY
MNRIDRLTAIIIQLQTKRLHTATEIAEKFDISIRTVYRDLRALDEAGVPIGTEAGKGYFLVEGYHLPPVMFTREEAGAMLIAGKLVDKLTDSSVRKQFQLAIDKIKAVLPTNEKEIIEGLNNRVEVFYSPVSERAGYPNNYISEIQQALASNKCVLIDYDTFYSQEKTKNRVVDPIGLVYYSNTWHMIGFCKFRKDIRDFRVDRISALKITNEPASIKKENELKEYFSKVWDQGELNEVTVWFDNKVASSIVSVKYYFGYVDETIKDEGVEINFAVNDFNYIARWLLSYGNMIKIIRPLSLQELMVELVKDLSIAYLSQHHN